MNKIGNIKLKGGALQLTMLIAIIIAILLLTFLSLTYLKERFQIKASLFHEAVEAANQGIVYAGRATVPHDVPLIYAFYPNKAIETELLKTRWGIYDLVTSKAKWNNESFIQTALLGGYQQNKIALYLQEVNQPLVVVGYTHIQGDVFLPLHGVKRGSIAGHSYYGEQFIHGNTSHSSNKLPDIDNHSYILNFFKEMNANHNMLVFDLATKYKWVNSFKQPTYISKNKAPIVLSKTQLSGNIIIQSDIKITVQPSAFLQDVLLMAPQIVIEDAVKGNFQAFATESITVGSNCKLLYPSALIVLDKEMQSSKNLPKPEEHQYIAINKGTELKGVVAFLSNSNKGSYKSQVIIEDMANVTGEVYCNLNTELKGTVIGTVYTKGFIANQFGSVYINHIYNGKILSSATPHQYSGLLFKDTPQKVVKWLY